MRKLFVATLFAVAAPIHAAPPPSAAQAAIPATPVMTLYQFNGPRSVPVYRADAIGRSPVGSLTQGSSVIPCLVIRDGRPVTDAKGVPYVGFEGVVDASRADPTATERFKRAVAERKGLMVQNHHCAPGITNVVSVRDLYSMEKAPFFDPPATGGSKTPAAPGGRSDLDRIVRAFHASPQCAQANRALTGRRDALQSAWNGFIGANGGLGSKETLARAKHLDYVMRTALYEGHIGRGCNAYGACERNIIALSIRNRAVGQCQGAKGCEFPGDFQGAASAVSQYNIWDEYLTQISGLTSCFLRPDLAGSDYYGKMQAMYGQSVGDVERILFGDDAALQAIFPGNALAGLKGLRHYYHAPAMGKCFPNYERVEYMTGAVAWRGRDHALIANTRIQVGEKSGAGYGFKAFEFDETALGDVVRIVDRYPGFLVDARRVSLSDSPKCPAYGVPEGCRFPSVGRYRKVPGWLGSGDPIEITCHIQDRGESCRGGGAMQTVKVGGACDVEMRPITGVP